MPRTTSFTLGKHFEGFIAGELESGRYTSGSEVIREGLRLLEERKHRLEVLRDALVEGERSGPNRAVGDDFWDDVKRRGRARAGLGS